LRPGPALLSGAGRCAPALDDRARRGVPGSGASLRDPGRPQRL